MTMYLDPESYADYITAYKTFMFDVAKVVARELGSSSVTDESINADVENAFEFEKSIAMVIMMFIMSYSKKISIDYDPRLGEAKLHRNVQSNVDL